MATGIARTGLEAWHRVLRDMSSDALDEILAEDVVFHSPVVHTPQQGRDLTKLYLMAAYNVMPGDADSESDVESSAKAPAGSFRYVREVVGSQDAVLEFVTEIDGIIVNGVDMIRWNDEGRIVDFKVMIRPLKAIQKVHAQMAEMLENLKKRA